MKLRLSPDILALNPGVGKTIAVERDQKAAKQGKVPRAAPFERDGLSTLLALGWSTRCEWRGGALQWQLYQIGGRMTAWHLDQSSACEEAKRLEGAKG